MSEREDIQNKLVEFLEGRGFNAPYGVIPALEPTSGRGRVRTVTFGVARTLDCTVYIWNPKRFVVESAGPLSSYLSREYTDFDALLEVLEEIAPKPKLPSKEDEA